MRDAAIREFRHWARTLTPLKVWNAAQVMSSYYLARWQGKPVHWGMPISVGIEPTTACNLRCPQCPSGLRSFSRPTGRLDEARFRALVDELHPYLCYLILYFQGEPYLNPAFLDMVRYAADHGVYTMTSTNAHFLDDANARKTVESGLGRLVISLDGTNQETYEQYRVGGSFSKVLEGTRNVMRWRRELAAKGPFVDLQFIVFSHNQHEVEAARQLGRELGVDRVSVKTAQIYDFDRNTNLIPQDEQLSRYQKRNGRYVIKNKLLNHCWKLWHGAEITWDGRVLPCCFDKDARYEMGRFPDASFRKIWKDSPAYAHFRAQLLQDRKNIDICRNCTEGTQVWS
ncbi:MAG: radical SAM protein [Bacteroidetes bacterium]|nr:radical SAM protein [Bacteroidota bacterium]